MPLFCMAWKLHADKKTQAMTYFAGLTDEDHKRDQGANVKVFGRWHNLASLSGNIIAEAPTADDVFKWAYNWSEETCNIDIFPVMDHNKLREMVLGEPPTWTFSYDRTNEEPKEGETLYLCRYKFRDVESSDKGYQFGCSMSWDDDMEANGKAALQHLGRWHMPNEGKGVFLGVTKDHNALFTWANKWKPLAEMTFEPVLTDKAAAKIIKQKHGYEKKLAAMMEHMKTN